MVLELCEIIQYVHQHNIIHRDLKPHNIFLTIVIIQNLGILVFQNI